MKRLYWIFRAYMYMRSRCGWANWGMCASLYETCVIGGWASTPEEAVEEEMSYWD